jgi:hypothetical protein
MAIPFTDILQDGDLPVRSLGVYTHFSDIVVYAPRERIRTERVKCLSLPSSILCLGCCCCLFMTVGGPKQLICTLSVFSHIAELS